MTDRDWGDWGIALTVSLWLVAASIALGAALAAACAHGYGIVPPPARAGDPNAKLVLTQPLPYASETAWHRSPYWRPWDVGWPWYVIIANDSTACPLFANVVFLPNPDEFFACPTSWRQARP